MSENNVTPEMIAKAKKEWVSKPMGPYSSWADCKKAGKSDAYCGYLYHHASPEGHGKSMNRDTILLASNRFKSLVPNVQQPLAGGQAQSEEALPQRPPIPGQAPPQPPKPGEAPQGAKPVPDNAEAHGQFAYGLGMRSVQDAQQQLQQRGYRLTGTSAHMGDNLVHTYAHPEGHTIELHSEDGNMVSGIEYKIPKPAKPQNPGANVFQSNAGPKQEGLAPAAPGMGPTVQPTTQGTPTQPAARIPAVPGQSGIKQDMPTYQGGAAMITGQGRKSFIPKGVILGPGEQMGGKSTFCGICHTAIGTVVHYKGLEICRRCASITPGVTRQSVRK